MGNTMNQKDQKYVKQLIAGGLILFVAFMVHWVFIHSPDVYATKNEVNELKQDICEDLIIIKADIQYLIRLQVEESHFDLP